MTLVPRTLEEWTLESVQELVDLELSENDQFDFKHSFEARNFGPRLRGAVCSFANSQGGFLVFGVADQGRKRERIVGLPRSREYTKLIQDQLKKVEPSVFVSIQDPPIRLDGEQSIVIVHVPQGRRGPHWDVDERRFWRRGNGTKVEMTHEEVRMAFTDHAERVGRMRLLFLSLIDNWTRMEMILRSGGAEGPIPITTVDPATIRAVLGEVQSVQPDLVQPLLIILRAIDSVASRIVHMLAALGSDLEHRKTIGREHKYGITHTMQDIHPRMNWVLSRLQEAYGFESVAPLGGHKVPPLPPPGLL